MKKVTLLVCLILAAMTGCIDSNTECYERPIDLDGEDDGPWILADHYHATKQNPEDYRLTKTEFGYQGVFGFHRVFQHLERNDYNWSSIRDVGLSPERLEGYDILFINLVSSDRPDFTDDEVAAIIDFVKNGGGLYVIADHTNVYRHAERVNRFLIPMGIEVLYHIAVDRPPEHSIAGLGWILVKSYADHPVADGLDIVSLQTGGPLRSDSGGVAFTSDESFADLWDPNDSGGYYGNWRYDGDPEVEPLGPLEVVTAVEYGEGRIVVVGDQNIFGDAWLHFVDNFELAVNGFDWLAKLDAAQTPLRLKRPVGTMIGIDQAHTEFRGGKPGAEGHWVWFVNSNRDAEITGRGSIRFDNVDDALFIHNASVEFEPDDLAAIRQYMKDGKSVFMTFEADEITAAQLQLLNEFAPEFTLTVDGNEIKGDALLEVDVPRVKTGAHFGLESNRLQISDLSIASYEEDPTDEENVDGDIAPYLLNVSSTWGEKFIDAKNGPDRISIARSKTVEQGEFVVFVQDGFWRNRTMGKYLRAPRDYNRDVHTLQYRLFDFLKVDVPVEREPIDDISRCN